MNLDVRQASYLVFVNSCGTLEAARRIPQEICFACGEWVLVSYDLDSRMVESVPMADVRAWCPLAEARNQFMRIGRPPGPGDTAESMNRAEGL